MARITHISSGSHAKPKQHDLLIPPGAGGCAVTVIFTLTSIDGSCNSIDAERHLIRSTADAATDCGSTTTRSCSNRKQHRYFIASALPLPVVSTARMSCSPYNGVATGGRIGGRFFLAKLQSFARARDAADAPIHTKATMG